MPAVDLGTLIRREWGAVSFVITVLLGLIIVPLAFIFLNRGPAPVNLPAASPSPTVASSPSPSPHS